MPLDIERLNAALEGRYRIQRELGEGGMATVYLAEDVRHERKVAVKILRPELAAVVGAERFLGEIKTTANLQHPHILPLFDSGEADGFLYYVMPYIEGETLRDRLGTRLQLGREVRVTALEEFALGGGGTPFDAPGRALSFAQLGSAGGAAYDVSEDGDVLTIVAAATRDPGDCRSRAARGRAERVRGDPSEAGCRA